MQLPACPGAGGWSNPCSTAWGGGTCPHICWGGAGSDFPSQGGLGVADGPFPFLLGPCKERFSGGFLLFFFFPFCEFCFSFPAFLLHEVCLSMAVHVAQQLESSVRLSARAMETFFSATFGERFFPTSVLHAFAFILAKLNI